MSATKVPNITELKEVILELLRSEGLEDSCFSEILNYSLDLFNKENLDSRYYGYHNASHELVVTHNTLLASRGEDFQDVISNDDFRHLFAAALFHDYEPEKTKDKPHEEIAANFVTIDRNLLSLFKEAKIDPYIVAVLILRTTYPWEQYKDKLQPMIADYFSKSKYANDEKMQEHVDYLGWYMSVADRIGAYSLGDFLDAMELAKKNAHSLGWDPQYLVRRSISFFEKLLDGEEGMTDQVMRSLPTAMRKTFMENVIGFYQLRQIELEVKSSIQYDKIELVPKFEDTTVDEDFAKKLFDIYDELPDPLQFKRTTFFESLKDPETILITLRLSSNDELIGFAKGGPLESYSLPSSIKDENYGRTNTVFMEPIALKMGYWGQGGGPKLRKIFKDIAKQREYKFVTSLQLREVIQNRIKRKENIEFVQQLDPERLDYFRVIL